MDFDTLEKAMNVIGYKYTMTQGGMKKFFSPEDERNKLYFIEDTDIQNWLIRFVDREENPLEKRGAVRTALGLQDDKVNSESNQNDNNKDMEAPTKESLTDKLEKGVREVIDSENFKNWLNTSGKMFYNNYSFTNSILLWLQNPDVSYVMGYNNWQSFGRNVCQGAKGLKIISPIMTNEKFKGGLFGSIKKSLKEQLDNDKESSYASYRLGQSKFEFTLNRANNLIGVKIDGIERGFFNSDDECKKYIERNIIGKVPAYFKESTVFDIKDVVIPEYLWVKSGFTKSEIVLDENNKPIVNKRGETKIYNTLERQEKFKPFLDTNILPKDTEKMEILFDACVAVCEARGLQVILKNKENDEHIKSGAEGYYNRQNDNIIIDETLEQTKKCAVLFHEMAHADLHKKSNDLTEIKEIQAEAVSYMTAINFGIETDTSSFAYMAAYTKGFELQELKKSLEIIYNESRLLTNDLKLELESRGFNLDMTKKEMEVISEKDILVISQQYIDVALNQDNMTRQWEDDLYNLIGIDKDNAEIMSILKEQKLNIDISKECVSSIKQLVEKLNNAKSRLEQDDLISKLDKTKERNTANNQLFAETKNRFSTAIENSKKDLKVDFYNKPRLALVEMRKEYPQLKELSRVQMDYIAKSKYILNNYSDLLQGNVQEFVNNACDRAKIISNYASENGTFVEINFCEDVIFEAGELCHPKIADELVKEGEVHIRELKELAEKEGKYYPYSKCDMIIFTPSEVGLNGMNIRVDIGDGEQESIENYLSLYCNKGDLKKVCDNFKASLLEKDIEGKRYIPSKYIKDIHSHEKLDIKNTDKTLSTDKGRSMKEWELSINEAKDNVKEGRTLEGRGAKENEHKTTDRRVG